MQTSRGVRVVRGATIGAFATFVAALSHTLGGGAAPGFLALTLSFVFALLLSIALTGRRVSRMRTALSVLASQLLLHLLYTIATPALAGSGTASTASAGSLGALGPHAGHGFAGLDALGASGVPLIAGDDAGHHYFGPAMVLSHLAAATLTILALHHGDAAVAALMRAATLRLRVLWRVVAPVVLPSASVRRPGSTPVLSHPLDVVLSTVQRRGPPRSLPAC